MSQKKMRLLRKQSRLLTNGTGEKYSQEYGHYKEVKRRIIRSRAMPACPKINMKKLKRRRKSMMAQLVRAAERRGRTA